ncbi:MAG: hypothetical protein ILA24_04280 [Ruminococcus sp.]|jgi:MFS family permease|nr:hypothetical protein [Ruminococcus sp.]
MQMVSEKTFYSQMSGNSAGPIVATVLSGIVLGGCGVFCGTQLGWKHILSLVFLAAGGLCCLLLIFFIIKGFRKKSHPVFKRYGNAAYLSMKINQGMANAWYYAEPFGGNFPFATLMTDSFIVSGSELTNYMEFKDLRTVHVDVSVTVHRIAIGDPFATAASLAANRVGDRILESKGINGDNRFDIMVFEDERGKKYRYNIHHCDVQQVLGMVAQVAPHIRYV